MLCINKRLYRPDRSHRSKWSDRPNRPERRDRSDRSNRSEWSDRPDGSNRSKRGNRRHGNRISGQLFVCIFDAVTDRDDRDCSDP